MRQKRKRPSAARPETSYDEDCVVAHRFPEDARMQEKSPGLTDLNDLNRIYAINNGRMFDEIYHVISNETLKNERAKIIKAASEGVRFVIIRQDGKHVKIGPSEDAPMPAEYLEIVELLQKIPSEKIGNIREMLLQVISLARPTS